MTGAQLTQAEVDAVRYVSDFLEKHAANAIYRCEFVNVSKPLNSGSSE